MLRGMDAIGTEIWHLLERPLKVSEICDELMTRYDVERGVYGTVVDNPR